MFIKKISLYRRIKSSRPYLLVKDSSGYQTKSEQTVRLKW